MAYLPLLLVVAGASVTGFNGYFIGAADDWPQRVVPLVACIMSTIAAAVAVCAAWHGGRASAFTEAANELRSMEEAT